MLQNDEVPSEGLFIAGDRIWLSGTINGCVITKTLRCNDKPTDNCIGDGSINRRALSPKVTLPLELISDIENLQYKASQWKIL